MKRRALRRLLACSLTACLWGASSLAIAQETGETATEAEPTTTDETPAEAGSSTPDSDSAGDESAEGEAAPTSAPPKDEAARILSLIKNANDEFARGEFDDALRLYEEAYEQYPQPVLLYRIGNAAEKHGDTRKAIDAYRKFAEQSPAGDPTAAKMAARADELQATLPPRVTVTTAPAGATVFLGSVDGQTLGITPGTFDLTAGPTTLVLQLDGYQVSKEELELANGTVTDVAVSLAPLERLTPAEPVAVATAEPEQDGGLDLRTIGYITGGVGVALIGTGVVFSALSAGKTNDVNDYDKRAPGASRAELEEMKEQAVSFYKTSVPLYVAGGILTAAGVTLVVLDSMGDEPSARFDFNVSPDGATAGISGRF